MRSGSGFSGLLAMGALLAVTWGAACATGGSGNYEQPGQADAGKVGCLTCGPGPTTCKTTISGKVYDPAAKNPLYGVAVYIPARPLAPLPRGVPTGPDACSCNALYKSGAVASTTTSVDGSFVLKNVPAGEHVPLVLQIGKWRRQIDVEVRACHDNPQADRSLALPATVAPGSTTDNMPDIAVSTGSADSLECLLTRIGLPASEYVAGAGDGKGGHVHVFSGGDPYAGPEDLVGTPESPTMPGTPQSDRSLWDSIEHMMPYDITLLSCEGGETYDARPKVLEEYLDAGGRVFASHYHYAWFTKPAESGQSYEPPPDWGDSLATWTVGRTALLQSNGVIVQSLNGSDLPFAKGTVMAEWLLANGALGVMGAPPTQLPIIPPRYNAQVTSANKASQPWIEDPGNGYTMYFSFDTPVNAPPRDGGVPAYCGRAVFSDLHVGGEATPPDSAPPPGGCTKGELSPQEKALEFMLFDLSSCVVDDALPPPDGGMRTKTQ